MVSPTCASELSSPAPGDLPLAWHCFASVRLCCKLLDGLARERTLWHRRSGFEPHAARLDIILTFDCPSLIRTCVTYVPWPGGS